MATYELCVNEETRGGGVIYDTLELAIVAGEAAITPVEREDIPMTVDEGVFFHGARARRRDGLGLPLARVVFRSGRLERTHRRGASEQADWISRFL